MADRSGHGRRSRPETFTMRPASQRLNDVGDGRRAPPRPAAAPTTRKSISRLGVRRGREFGVWPWRLQHALERAAQRGPEALLVGAEVQHARRSRRSAPMIAAQNTRWPTGYHSMSPAAVGRDRPRQQREIAEPPGRQADADQERDEEEDSRTRAPRPAAASTRRDQRRPDGSSRAPRSGSAAARDRTAGRERASRTRPRRTAAPPPRPRQYR